MTTLVTGANGFVGQAVCRHLAALGEDFRAAVRAAGTEAARNHVPVGDIGAATDWSSALAGAETVVHLAARVHVMRETATDPLAAFRAVNVAGTANLARQAAAARIKRFIFVSTIKVNGEESGDKPFSESDAPAPRDAYALSKWEAEQTLGGISSGTGMQVVILRPPLIYGPGVGGNFLRLMRAVARGLPLPLGGVHNQRSLIYVGNLAEAIMTCLTHPAAAARTFLVSDRETISTPELIVSLGAALGRPARLVSVPPALLRTGAALVGRRSAADRLLGSLEVDSSRIGRELGWRPPYSLREGLADTVAWYRGLTAASSKNNMRA